MTKRGQAVRRERFLPYRYEKFGLGLRPLRGLLDGAREVESFNVDRHLIDLSEFRFDVVELEMEVEVTPDLIARVFPTSEQQRPPGTLLLAVRCPSTRLRSAVEVTTVPLVPGLHQATVRLDRSAVLGSAEVTPFLTRASEGPVAEGFARSPGARLASARAWEIRLDLLRKSGGAYLDIRYISFRENPAQFARPENLYQLECEETPLLWLNRSQVAAMPTATVIQTRIALRVPRHLVRLLDQRVMAYPPAGLPEGPKSL